MTSFGEPENDSAREPVASSVAPPGWAEAPPVVAAGPPTPPAQPGRRRPLLWLGLATIVALAAILLISLRDGGPSGGPFAPIANAAERTQRSPGARIAGTGSVTVQGRQLTMQFSGEYNGRADRTLMRLQMQSPQAPQVAAMMNPFVVVQDGPVSYMSTPAFAGQLPDGKAWMSIDASDFPGAEQQQGSATDAGALLDQLRSVGGEATKLGADSVRGVRATHYEAVVEVEGSSSTVGVWVDRQERVRRMVITAPFNLPGEPPALMAMQLDFYDFGIDPQIDAPPASATFDATAIARQGLDQALDAS